MISPTYKRLFDLIPYLVDEEIGIINQLISLPRQTDMPDFMYFKAIVANTGVFGGEENFSVAGGTALTRERALAKALGEGVERYASALYNWDELVPGRYHDFPEKAVHPEAFATFSEEAYQQAGFPFHPFTEQSILRWSKVQNLRTGLEELVPAAMVYCPYSPDESKGEKSLMEAISTGLASHLSYEEAALNGILEVVERDSFMLSWLSAAAPPELDPDSLMPDHQEMIRRYAQFGYKVTLYDIRSDTQIPTFMGIMKGTYGGSVPFLASAATHLNPVAAVTKCLEELALIERYGKRLMLNGMGAAPSDEFGKIVHLIDHLRYWMHESTISESGFLNLFNPSIMLEDIADECTGTPEGDLEKARSMVNKIGHEVLIADITSPDVGALGFHVVRAVIPGFLPLNKRYNCRPVQSERLRSQLALQKKTLSDINPLPHPFA